MRRLLLASIMLLAYGCATVDHRWDAKDAPNEAEAQKICQRHGMQARSRGMAEDYGQHFRVYIGYECVVPGEPTPPDAR